MQVKAKDTRSIDNLLAHACHIKNPEVFYRYRMFLLNGHVVGVTSPQGDLYELKYNRGMVIISAKAPVIAIPPQEFTITDTTGGQS